MRRRSMIWTAILAVSLATFSGCRTDGDRLEVPTPDSTQFVAMRLTAVNATSPDVICVAGYLTKVDGSPETILLRSENGGQKWIRIGAETFPFSSMMPQFVHFNDSLRGWVAGVRIVDGETLPVILRTEDSGGHWKEAPIPHDRATTVTELTDLHFDSDDSGEVTVHFVQGDATQPLANVYMTTDGGRHWVIKDFTDPKTAGPTDPAEIFVSESEGYRLGRPMENGTQILYFTGTKGETWVPRSQFHLSQLPSYY